MKSRGGKSIESLAVPAVAASPRLLQILRSFAGVKCRNIRGLRPVPEVSDFAILTYALANEKPRLTVESFAKTLRTLGAFSLVEDFQVSSSGPKLTVE